MLRKFMLMGAAALFFVPSADAGLQTYFGQDNGPLTSVPAGGNAETARNSFLASLAAGVGTEDFESFNAGQTSPINLTFPGSSGNITATLSGSEEIESGVSLGGRFPTSGDKFWETSSGGDFSISFGSAISAFGFYGTDLGDIQGDLVLTLTDTNGAEVQETVNVAGSPDASLAFWGFTDDMNAYTTIAFENTGAGDVFGFDDMTVGDLGQVVNPTVPEPGSLAIFGVIGVAVAYRRRRKTKKA